MQRSIVKKENLLLYAMRKYQCSVQIDFYKSHEIDFKFDLRLNNV